MDFLYHFVTFFMSRVRYCIDAGYRQKYALMLITISLLFCNCSSTSNFFFLSFSIDYQLNCNILLVELKTCFHEIDSLTQSFYFPYFLLCFHPVIWGNDIKQLLTCLNKLIIHFSICIFLFTRQIVF